MAESPRVVPGGIPDEDIELSGSKTGFNFGDSSGLTVFGRSSWRPFALYFIFSFLAALALAMSRGLSHDEHQHIAAGALLAREGLLPFRDYPYFHLPHLPLIYGFLFGFGDHLLLLGRLFSVICIAGAVGLAGASVHGLWLLRDRRSAWLISAATVVLCLSSPVFSATAGRAWNQEPALLLLVAAFLLHVAALQRGGRLLWMGMSGLFLGLCIGTRITYAPLLAPFVLAVFFSTGFHSRLPGLLALFGAGLLAGLAPTIWLWALAPEQAYFCTAEFPKVNITYRFSTGEPRTMTLLKKLRYTFKEIIRFDAGLCLAFLAPVAALLLRRSNRPRIPAALVFLLVSIPFLLLGSLAPSPLYEQYFFPFAIFLSLGGAYALASIPEQSPWYGRMRATFLGGVALSCLLGGSAWLQVDEAFRLRHWTPIVMHEEGKVLASKISSPGRVLTLGPLLPLEGGRGIYPAFATGPFAWRVSPFVEPSRASNLRLVTPATLEESLAHDPPAALLVEVEERWEEPLIQYGETHRYRRVRLENDDALLLVRP